jgi:hypothetical protein
MSALVRCTLQRVLDEVVIRVEDPGGGVARARLIAYQRRRSAL